MPDQPGPKPSIPYWRLRIDRDGVSHQRRCALTGFQLKGIGAAAENPAPQWMVVLSSRWWIESMDGFRIEQGPGGFSLREDQNCTGQDGKRGHRSGTVGGQPAALMTVQLHVEPQRASCHAR